jgi:hypothetical protein
MAIHRLRKWPIFKVMSSPVNTVVEQPLAPTRRDFLRGVGGAFAVAAVRPGSGSVRQAVRLNIALADRSTGVRGGIAVLAIARTIGVAAVEIDFGRLGGRPAMLTALGTAEGRQHLLDAAGAQDQTIFALAMNVWREQSFADHPRAVEITLDAIAAAKAIDAKAITLPLAHADDLAIEGFSERWIANLKQLAPAAEAAGVTIAVNGDIPPADMKRLLDAVGSSAVVAAVSATSVESVAEAFAVLGVRRVAQIRISFDPSTTPVQQLALLRDACNAAAWAGWVVIDRLAASPDDLQAVGTRAVAALSGALATNIS